MPNPHRTKNPAWLTIAIVAMIATGFMMAIIFFSTGWSDAGLPRQQAEPLLPPVQDSFTHEISGDGNTWRALASGNYPFKQMTTNTSTGERGFTYKLVPENDLPFVIPRGSLVVVFHALTPANQVGYMFGYIAPSGWWLMFFPQPTLDQVIIADLLTKAIP